MVFEVFLRCWIGSRIELLLVSNDEVLTVQVLHYVVPLEVFDRSALRPKAPLANSLPSRSNLIVFKNTWVIHFIPQSKTALAISSQCSSISAGVKCLVLYHR
jgi:hypothetical protein